MKKIYSLKKEILFKNNIYDIVSIALDKKFSLNEYELKGLFKINGEYLIKENEKDEFNIDIPYLNYIEDTYDTSNIKVDIDDFYYEIKDSNKLVINIDIAVEGLEERCIEQEDDFFVEELEDIKQNDEDIIDTIDNNEMMEEDIKKIQYDEEENDMVEYIEENKEVDCVIDDKEDYVMKKEENNQNIEQKNDYIDYPREEVEVKQIIEEYTKEEKQEYVTYRICIVRPGDTMDTILQRFNTDLETIQKYNIVNELNVGDKIIIPYERNK